MKQSKILISMLFCFFNMQAQTGYQDVVYLKNGGIIRGIIIEQVPSQSIKIQTRDKNVFVFKMDEIEKIAKEKPTQKAKFEANLNLDSNSYSGFAFILEAAIGSGNGSYNTGQSIGSFHALIGYMHESIFTIGLSLGLSQWTSSGINYPQTSPAMDACLAFRVFPLKKRLSPLLMCDFGYGLVTDNEYVGGMQYGVGAGARVSLTNRRAANLGLMYKSQYFMRNENYSNYYYNSNKNVSSFYLNGFCLQMGYTF